MRFLLRFSRRGLAIRTHTSPRKGSGEPAPRAYPDVVKRLRGYPFRASNSNYFRTTRHWKMLAKLGTTTG